MRGTQVVLALCLLHAVAAVKVKMIMHSEQDDSKIEEEDIPRVERIHVKKKTTEATMLPFLRNRKPRAEEKLVDYEEEKPVATTEKAPKTLHPNDMLFPLIYRQSHINSMFKFGENWYTWSVDKQSDGSKVTNYYICYDEPKRCDDIGWEHADAPPKCAFEIDSLSSEDRACINSFGVEPQNTACDGAEQMKVSDIVHACGPRIRSLWRFTRVGRRPTNAAKPADVNSLICEDEDECYVSVEYRIHHDRITFSLHEPSRGQTFKSTLKRDVPSEDEVKPTEKVRESRRKKTSPTENHSSKFRVRPRSRTSEGKGIQKEHDDSDYVGRRAPKNKIRVKEDISEDNSE